MWPRPGEALDRTLAAESAVEGLYREALTRWAPVAMAAALPTFAVTAAAQDEQQLPPDPAAVEQESGWSTVAETVIVAGVAVLFAAAVVEAMQGLGIPLPGLPDTNPQESAGNPLVAPPSRGPAPTSDQGKQDRPRRAGSPAHRPSGTDRVDTGLFPQGNATKPQVAPDVIAIVSATTGVDPDELHDAMRIVDGTPALAEARDKAITVQRDAAAKTPTVVAAKITTAIRHAEPDDAGQVTLTAQRTAAATVLDPDGDVLSGLAADAGHMSAAVQNHAVQTAAEQSEEADELDKTWICTLDGRTRDTHWAADGARVPLSAPFIVGGEPLMYPADPAGSPGETYSCRCRLGILARDEPLPDEVDRHTERLSGNDSVAQHREGRTQAEEIRRRRDLGNTRARDNRDGIGTVASGGWTAPSRQEYDVTTPLAEAPEQETYLTFTDALFAVTGTATDDRRMLHADIDLAFRDCPLPLQWQEMTADGHKTSVTVGVIEALAYQDGEVRASGYMLNNENAFKALELIQHGVCNPSVDMADATAILAYDDGTEVTEANFDPARPVFETYTKATVTAATLVAIPAFGQTRMSLNAERETREQAAAMVASLNVKQPVYEPAMFADADPNLPGPMRLSIDDRGHVFGFIATWKDKHRSVGLGNIKPPRSATSYEHFHTSPGVHLTDGTVLPVGRLTIGIGHAPTRGITAAAAQAHYDNVEACWALGRISEHRFGIYFSGVVAPWASTEKVQMGLASPVSGDWRPIGPGNNLELVAVLGVNTPGFLCKVETDKTGAPLAMVASMGPATGEADTAWSIDDVKDDIKAAVTEALAENAARLALTERVDAVAARALAAVGEPPAPLSATERMGELIEALPKG